MLRFFILVVFALLEVAAAPAITVSVTLAPYAKMVRKIAGDRVDVVTLVPANANPHSFEPKPDALKKFASASIYFSDGSGLDEAWRPRFLSVNPKVRVANLSEGISFISEPEEHGHRHGDDHELDPHLWNSPRQVILVASNICKVLSEADTASAEFYRTNLENFSRELSALDVRFTEAVRSLPEERRTFIVFHPSYGYLARDYGLKQIAVEMDGKEPKPQDLQRLIQTAKANRAKIVFVQPQFSRRAAESLSREIGAKIVSIDPLAYDFDENLLLFLKTLAGDGK